MTKKSEKLADVWFRVADGTMHQRWTARVRWAATTEFALFEQKFPFTRLFDKEKQKFQSSEFALFDEEKQKFLLRKAHPGPLYWKAGTKKQVESYIKRTHVETFMRQRVEAELDKGQAA